MAFNIVAKLKVVPDDLSLQQLKNQIQSVAGGASGDATINIKLGPNTTRSLSALEKKLSSIITVIDGIPTAVNNAINSLNKLGSVKINIGGKVKLEGTTTAGGVGGGHDTGTVKRPMMMANNPTSGLITRGLVESTEWNKKFGNRIVDSSSTKAGKYVVKKIITVLQKEQREIDRFIEDFTSGKKMRHSKMNAGSFTIREMFGDEKFEQMVRQRTESINKTLEDSDNKLTAKAQARRERRKIQDVAKLKGIHERFIAGESISFGEHEFSQRAAGAHLGLAEFGRMFGGAQMVRPKTPGGKIRYVNNNTFEAMNDKKVEEALGRVRRGKATDADEKLLMGNPATQALYQQTKDRFEYGRMKKLAEKWAGGGKVDSSQFDTYAASNPTFSKFLDVKKNERQQFDIAKNQKGLDKKNRDAALNAYRSGKTLDVDQKKIIAGLYGDKTTRNIIADALVQRDKSLQAEKLAAAESEKKQKQLANDAAIKNNVTKQNKRLKKYNQALDIATRISKGGKASVHNYDLMQKILQKEGHSVADIDKMLGGGASRSTNILGDGQSFYRSDVAQKMKDGSADKAINAILGKRATPEQLNAVRSDPAYSAQLKAGMEKQVNERVKKALENIASGQMKKSDLDYIKRYQQTPIRGGVTQAEIDKAFDDGKQIQAQKQFDKRKEANQKRATAKAKRDADFLQRMNDRISRDKSISADQFDRAEKLQPGFGSNLIQMQSSGPGVAGRYISNKAGYKPPARGLDKFIGGIGTAASRFGAYALATTPMFAAAGMGYQGMSESIEFEREMIKIAQTLGSSTNSVKDFGDSILNLSVLFGQKATELAKSSRMFAQAGYSKQETQKLTELLGQTQLSASFDDMESTREGMIAVLQQFGEKSRPNNPVTVDNIQKVLDSINQVSADFAVESGDLVDAIRRAGSIFASSTPKGVGGVETSQQLMSLFTAIRDTTRLQPEMISTALVKVGSKLQTAETQKAIQANLGVNVRDENNQFIGIYESLRLIADSLSKYEGTDPMFPLIAQELGGAHHIAKVIPLLQNFGKVEQAMMSSKYGEGSLDRNAKQAMEAFGKQLEKIGASINKLINDIFQNTQMKQFVGSLLSATSGLLKLADMTKALVLPITALLAAVGTRALIGSGFGQSVKEGFGRAIHGPAWMQLTGFENIKKERQRRIAGVASLGIGGVIADNTSPDTAMGTGLKGGVSGASMGALIASSLGAGPAAVGLAALAAGAYYAYDALSSFSEKTKQAAKDELAKSVGDVLSSTKRTDSEKLDVLLSSIQSINGLNIGDSNYGAREFSFGNINNPYTKNANPFEKDKNGFNFSNFISNADRDKFAEQTKEQFKNVSQGVSIARRRFIRGEISEDQFKRIISKLAPILHAAEKSTEKISTYANKIVEGSAISKQFTELASGISEALNAVDKFSESLEKLSLSYAATGNARDAIIGRSSHALGEGNKFDVGLVSPKLAAGIANEKKLRDNLAKILIDGMGIDNEEGFINHIRDKTKKLLPDSNLPDMLPKIIRDDVGFDNIKDDITNGNVAKVVDKIMSPFDKLSKLQDQFTEQYKKVLDEIIKTYQMEFEKRQEMIQREGSLIQKRASLEEFVTGRKTSLVDTDKNSVKNLLHDNLLNGVDSSKYVGLISGEIDRIQERLQDSINQRDGLGFDMKGNQRQAMPVNSDAYKQMTGQIEFLVGKLANANQALDKLANSGENLAEIEKRRAAIEDASTEYILKSPAEQRKIQNNLRIAGNLLQSGKSLNSIGYKQRQEVYETLRMFKNVPLTGKGLDNMFGDEVWRRLMINSDPEVKFQNDKSIEGRRREIEAGETQQEKDKKRADALGAVGGKIKADADAKIQKDLEKAGLESSKIFADSMKIFENQTKNFADAVNRLAGAKIEMKGNFDMNVNINGAQVLENMQAGFVNIAKVEIFKALNILTQNRLKIGNLNPADIGLDAKVLKDNIGEN